MRNSEFVRSFSFCLSSVVHRYFIKIPWIIKKLFPGYIWSIPTREKKVYLTFDDGPHPVITPLVLSELKKYDAAATFFCIGKYVEQHPAVYQQIINEGHSVGNHTYSHYNGWSTNDEVYLHDVGLATPLINSNLFRPPYGRIRRSQAKQLPTMMNNEKVEIIMWDVLSADFDTAFTSKKCISNVLNNVTAGSIVVFHDSEKAWKNLKDALPEILKKLQEQGYEFCRL